MVDQNDENTIDVTSAITAPRNKGLGNKFRELMIECLAFMYSKNFEIISYSNSSENIERITSSPIRLINFSSENTEMGIQEHIIVEYAAICINVSLVPLICDYQVINVLKKTSGADYFCGGKKIHFILESKGDTTKYNFKTRIKEGKKQIRIGFEKVKNERVIYGLVGLSRFFTKHHYFIKIKKKEKYQKKVSEMQKSTIKKQEERDKELNKLKENSSQLITDAMALEAKGDLKESKKHYYLAFDKSVEIASELEKINSLEAIDYWFSAINCALTAEDYVRAMLVIRDLGENFGLTEYDLKELENLKRKTFSKIRIKEASEIPKSFFKKILNWILFKLEKVHGSIRGKGVVMKICLDLRLTFLQYGYYLPITFRVNRNPVHSAEINDILENYFKSVFIIHRDNNIILSPKARKKLSNEKSNVEQVIKSKFSEEFFNKVEELIESLGNKSSKELIAMEKEAGITAYQYGRPIINEGIRIAK